jgi:hypothetical protein
MAAPHSPGGSQGGCDAGIAAAAPAAEEAAPAVPSAQLALGWYELNERWPVRSAPHASSLSMGTLGLGARVNVFEAPAVRGGDGSASVRIRARYGKTAQAVVGWLCHDSLAQLLGLLEPDEVQPPQPQRQPPQPQPPSSPAATAATPRTATPPRQQSPAPAEPTAPAPVSVEELQPEPEPEPQLLLEPETPPTAAGVAAEGRGVLAVSQHRPPPRTPPLGAFRPMSSSDGEEGGEEVRGTEEATAGLPEWARRASSPRARDVVDEAWAAAHTFEEHVAVLLQAAVSESLPPTGIYRVHLLAPMTAALEPGAAPVVCGYLRAGQEVRVLRAGITAHGRVRLLTRSGWVNYRGRDGIVLLAPVMRPTRSRQRHRAPAAGAGTTSAQSLVTTGGVLYPSQAARHRAEQQVEQYARRLSRQRPEQIRVRRWLEQLRESQGEVSTATLPIESPCLQLPVVFTPTVTQ